MNYIIRPNASNKIRSFYRNVSKKYKNTYSLELMTKNITDALDSIYNIENGLTRRQPTISRWKGLYMAVSKDRKWYFAYRIDSDTVYVEDACHSQNMHESMNAEKLLRKIIMEEVRKCLHLI